MVVGANPPPWHKALNTKGQSFYNKPLCLAFICKVKMNLCILPNLSYVIKSEALTDKLFLYNVEHEIKVEIHQPPLP